MKRIQWALFCAMAIAGCKKERVKPLPEASLDKSIAIHVFAKEDYSDPIYSDARAQLRLQIRKINYRTGNMELLWDSLFTIRKLSDYPQQQNKLVIQKIYPVYDSKEKLNASYSILYNWNGNISQYGASEEVVPGETSLVLETDL